jgi:hypothetical protein
MVKTSKSRRLLTTLPEVAAELNQAQRKVDRGSVSELSQTFDRIDVRAGWSAGAISRTQWAGCHT